MWVPHIEHNITVAIHCTEPHTFSPQKQLKNATTHYDNKEYTEHTAVHKGIPKLFADTISDSQHCERRQGDYLLCHSN